MPGLLDELKADVAKLEGPAESAVAFIRGFVDKLRAAFNNNDWMGARHLTDEAHSEAPNIANAIVGNPQPAAEGSAAVVPSNPVGDADHSADALNREQAEAGASPMQSSEGEGGPIAGEVGSATTE